MFRLSLLFTREHGANQARDLLIHLWAGPATLAARTDIVVGPSSVEVRSAACSKASAVEKWIHEIFTEKHLDPSKCVRRSKYIDNIVLVWEEIDQ